MQIINNEKVVWHNAFVDSFVHKQFQFSVTDKKIVKKIRFYKNKILKYEVLGLPVK